ncbi:MAG: hydroxylase [Pseudomonadota bacterium]
MDIHYLEIVTPEVDTVCASYASLHGVTFSDPEQNLGGARTAHFSNGSILGVRAPMRESEASVVRHYLRVDDIQASVDAAAAAGAQVALPPMPLPGHGTCAIVIQGGIETGFWQL